jgi:hypothetical protein
MSGTRHVGALLVVAVLAFACATWVQVGGPVRENSVGVSAELPHGWMRLRAHPGILITRDGLGLEYIEIGRSGIEEELPNTNRRIEAGMLPMEVAELSIDSARLSQETTNFELAENAPAQIDGRDGYRIGYSHRTGSGLRVRTLRYGCIVGDFHYWIEYRAAAQHYFEAHLEDFERVSRSVRFRS